ncbi:pyridoxal 5'-phosphate synthase glutaminase subunit PdxT [Microcella flavibacter]|uniref:pyridoxal 5'-phosphate synthase glutaminase subunit PdxT n=1 Tax=Microcella flavibacter TaxID=1804990 RepID=UPI00145663DE|nr:pyridoxal 5'-phosphate synthase glutaminase subunit PdxT [Microcella flavibacter]
MAGSTPPVTVGVLALQGDVREHLSVLRTLQVEAVEVRRPADLERVDGLVIPGGESSVMDKLVRLFGLQAPLRARIAEGMPVYGTCAGLILLADTIENPIAGQQSLGGLDAVVRRNAFGSQSDSFETDLDVPALGEAPVHATFIRAPVVESVGAGVEVLARLDDGRIVAVEQGPLLGTSFHPEVEGEDRFHRRFLEKVRSAAASRR